MCGITGIYAFNENAFNYKNKVEKAVSSLRHRGPDDNGIYIHSNVALGHSRLAIIDTSAAASQPFTDASKRYTIVFNGEFYNFKEHRKILKEKGVQFRSNSDTEVLLYLYIKYGVDFIAKVNGCFALAIYDNVEKSLLLARDRMGINPLHIYQDENKLIFGSEIKAILEYNINREIDYESLYTYLQLNYIPGPHSIFKNIYKLTPGTYLKIKNDKIEKNVYYKIKSKITNEILSYNDAKDSLNTHIDNAVKSRLVSDVPLGTFLSGGIDSSVITAIASKYTDKLKTFSIGFKDEPFFDETYYANLVAKKFNTEHTVFSLTNKELFEHLFSTIDSLDEPFADSSALAVNILSFHTRKHVTVVLSGDGADEMFGGYNKHYAHFNALNNNFRNSAIKNSNFIFNILPKSRNNKYENKARQIHKYSKGLNLNDKERYWLWCSIANENYASNILNFNINQQIYYSRKNEILEYINNDSKINDILLSDMHLVLQNDMLVKVDMMSMANSLEVRTPFLDHNVVNFVFSLPDSYKINNNIRKRILQDTYKNILPNELYNRQKQGFEVPLLKWFQNDLNSFIFDNLLKKSFIKEQNIFNIEQIEYMRKRLSSNNPGDITSKIWGLLVFQYWWNKYYN